MSPIYDAVFWNPPQKYVFKNKRPAPPRAVKVYEAHGELAATSGMAQGADECSWNLDAGAADWNVQGVYEGLAAEDQELGVQHDSAHVRPRRFVRRGRS